MLFESYGKELIILINNALIKTTYCNISQHNTQWFNV